jgi:hypothetical protein
MHGVGCSKSGVGAHACRIDRRPPTPPSPFPIPSFPRPRLPSPGNPWFFALEVIATTMLALEILLRMMVLRMVRLSACARREAVAVVVAVVLALCGDGVEV